MREVVGLVSKANVRVRTAMKYVTAADKPDDGDDREGHGPNDEALQRFSAKSTRVMGRAHSSSQRSIGALGLARTPSQGGERVLVPGPTPSQVVALKSPRNPGHGQLIPSIPSNSNGRNGAARRCLALELRDDLSSDSCSASDPPASASPAPAPPAPSFPSCTAAA